MAFSKSQFKAEHSPHFHPCLVSFSPTSSALQPRASCSLSLSLSTPISFRLPPSAFLLLLTLSPTANARCDRDESATAANPFSAERPPLVQQRDFDHSVLGSDGDGDDDDDDGGAVSFDDEFDEEEVRAAFVCYCVCMRFYCPGVFSCDLPCFPLPPPLFFLFETYTNMHTTSFVGCVLQPLYARALYAFTATSDSELSFAAGATIEILSCDEDDPWWSGAIGQTEGWFPASYVKLLDEDDATVEDMQEQQLQRALDPKEFVNDCYLGVVFVVLVNGVCGACGICEWCV